MTHRITRTQWLIVVVLGALVLLALGARISYAEPNPAPRASYDATWWTIDGGGAQNLTGGVYTLSGTIGQPDASAATPGPYSGAGGFWASVQDVINMFLPHIRR